MKLSIKKNAIKLLLKTIFSTKTKVVREKAMAVLIIAHSKGLFEQGRMSILKEYLHEQMDRTLEKFKDEPNKILKGDVYKQLVFLIFSIVLDNTKSQNFDSEELDKIEASKFHYFDLIFKHFNSMEEETKNLLLKHYFYRMIGSEKFKESSGKPLFGPLTKDEFKSGLKHPVKIEESPLLELLKHSLRNLTGGEHN